MGKVTDSFMDVCRRWADDTGQPAYAAAYWVLLFLGGQARRREQSADLLDAPPDESSSRSTTRPGGHPSLDLVRSRIDELIHLGMNEEWLIASLAAAIADSLDDMSDAVHGQARRKRVGAEIRAIEADPDRREESIARWRSTQDGDHANGSNGSAEANFEQWVAASLETVELLTFEEWLDRMWVARRWRELAGPIMSVSALLERKLPFSLR